MTEQMAQSSEKRRQKETLYQLFARIGQALSSPRRLELLDLLAQAPRTVEELAREANMSVANTSQHLQRLKQAQLVTETREGIYMRYHLADPAVARLWLELRAVAEQQLAEVRDALAAYRSRQHEFEHVSAEALRERLQNGAVILLDVRPRAEYDAGHLPGARSVPLEELEERLGELPGDLPVVAYCRGPYCVFADEALALLSERGWQVARLEEGVVEWQQAGYPVVSHSG
jgi:rhodanese-related sulfurtransferase